MGHGYHQKSVYAKVDVYGRVYFDKCETDEEHAEAPVKDGDDRRRCRVYLDQLIDKEDLGVKGTWSIKLTFEPET